MQTDAPPRSVGDILSNRLLRCAPDVSVAEAAGLMRAQRCSSVVVVENGRAIGIWTERDALKLDLSADGAFDTPLVQVMSRHVKSIGRDMLVSEAGLRFKRDKIRHLLVVDDDDAPIGMLSQTDVILNHGVEHYLTFRDVRSVMSQTLVQLDAGLPLCEAMRRMRAENCEAAIVTSPAWDGAGIVTERDVVRMIAERRQGAVGEAASRPVVAVPPSFTLLAARDLFTQYGFRHLAVRADDGTFLGLLSFSDILSILQYEYAVQINAALRERDEALVRSRRDLNLARQVIEASLDGVMIVNEDGLVDYVNPAFTRLTGYAATEILGRNPRLLQSGLHDAGFYDGMWQALRERGYWMGEVWNRRKDGEIYAEWLTINTIRDHNGRITKYSGTFSDITEKKNDEERVRSLAYSDSLTQLPNRRLFSDRLEQGIAAAHRNGGQMAVMFLDLDLFKRINDSLGHDVGDMVLVCVAQRLQDCLREGDTVARLGGDEFAILLPTLQDPADAARLAERLIEAMRHPIPAAGHSLRVTTSIGIALYPEDATTPDGLLKCADQAMYQSKEVGRNRFHLYSATSNNQAAERLSAEHSLRQALARGEFHLAYQVKVEMTSGDVSGVEALVRWTHPERGEVPPGEFIPLAERLGLMPALGEWILRTACRQGRAWLERGLPPVRLAVNLSPQQVVDPAFPPAVAAILAESGFPPELLELELTERALIDHPAETGRVLRALHASGPRLVLDDFGSSPSSLVSLSHLPIQAVKVDQGFVDGLGQAFADRDLVAAIVRLAHALGITAVAEGVERPAQVAALKEAGCDEIQGYLISRAVPPEKIDGLFAQPLLAVN
ncbi:cyclic di-GMP phosphodiesterase Gmr [mine drainage metagenome]|uniref:Cyclic di-GMP phosphodiesterase Gmr n=1 Tax=mine drainage metagenome TaxID=410659 RepID=A0A1J5S2M1_9ZZZZ